MSELRAGPLPNTDSTEASAASTSLRVDEPLRRAASGPPAHAVSKGARIGKGAQRVVNGAWRCPTAL